MDSLLTIDYELRKLFPRWKVCEPDLQFQIHQAFKIYGFSESELNIEKIEVLAAPKPPREREYDILMITCGDAMMNSQEIDANIKQLAKWLSGDDRYNIYERPSPGEDSRTYCFTEIPPELPVKPAEASTIISYLQPENKTQAFTLSLFEQSLKIGDTGFWLEAETGTDEVGYQFWSAGESKVKLKRPLMNNTDPKTRQYVPRLIEAYLGGGYRINSGIDNEGTIFSWVPNRLLNAGPGGKFIGGMDIHMPFHPQFGVGVNMELPLMGLRTESINPTNYGTYSSALAGFNRNDPRSGDSTISFSENGNVAPVLRSTGQFTMFYNWWSGGEDDSPSHFIRLDAGVSYALVDEYLVYDEEQFSEEGVPAGNVTYLERQGAVGLRTYKNNEFADWLYLKLQYRNQQAFPFSVSAQLSNQIFLAEAYLPLFGDWLLLQGKFSTPLRDARPFEIENFFMISPVFRITI